MVPTLTWIGLLTVPLAGLVYALLIASVALVAVFTSVPRRRRTALRVLRLLIPGRRSRDA
jgi:hypothetical protein